ncbi:MAG: DNA repair protein RecO [Syntrophaceae bacterium]
MPRWKTQAIILNSLDFSESDRIVHALTKDRGLINAMAKGARRSIKRFPGTLEPFGEVILDIFSKPGLELARLEEARLLNAHLRLREDIALFAHASVMIEVVLTHLGPYDPHPDTYQILKHTLDAFETHPKWFALWASGMINLLRSLGYGLDTQEARQGRPLPMHRLSTEAVTFMDKGASMEGALLAKLSLSARARGEIETYILDLCEKVGDRALKSRPFLTRVDLYRN